MGKEAEAERNRCSRRAVGHPRAQLGCLLFLLLTASCERGSQTGPPAAAPTLPPVQGFHGLAPSPLPSVSLGPRTKTPFPVGSYREDYEFSDDWFTYNIPVREKAFAPYAGRPGLRYLEVGAFEGRSLLWALENVLTGPGARATVIDLFEGDLKRRFLANLKRSGEERKVTVIAGYSQIELRRQPLDGYDIAYIDGSHSADDVLEDAILTWRLLKPGGLLIFDDYERTQRHAKDNPGPALDVFYTFYGRHFEVVHAGYQLILRKRADGAVQ